MPNPCSIPCSQAGLLHAHSFNQDDEALWHRLQEIESALLGPDAEDANLCEFAGEVTASWEELLDDLLLPERNIQNLVISEVSPAVSVLPLGSRPALEAQMASASAQSLSSSACVSFSSSNAAASLAEQAVSPSPTCMLNVPATQHPLISRSSGSSVCDLLVACATAIAEENLAVAELFMQEIRKAVSVYGNPMERLAAYMSEGLVARLHASGSFLYKALKCVEAPAAEVLSAMQKLYEICPYFKFAYMAANGAIMEACKDEGQLHIFDFHIDQGTQWFSLIQALANRPEGPPSIRVTSVDDPRSPPVVSIQSTMKRLGKLAASMKVPFEFNIISGKLSELQAHMIETRPEEALVVNSTLQLHHMPDESVCETNPRDRLLRMIKSLGPKVVTMIEQEANTNTTPFLPRFKEALDYYSAVFDSIDVALPRDSKDRVNVEEQCLARDIVNVIACEGWERVERHELTGKWRMRMMMAGYRPCPLSSHVNRTIQTLLSSYSTNYRLQEEGEALLLGWLNRPLVAASAWQ